MWFIDLKSGHLRFWQNSQRENINIRNTNALEMHKMFMTLIRYVGSEKLSKEGKSKHLKTFTYFF